MTDLTIAYITFRKFPRFEWFARSLRRELRSMPDVDHTRLQLLVIDGRLWETLAGDAAAGIARKFEFHSAAIEELPWLDLQHTTPKPTPWQGPARQTTKDYFAAASTRNTAFMLAKNPHVVFVDDLSVLLPGWLKAHYYAAEHRMVLAGTTCKNKDIVVTNDGRIQSYVEYKPGRDSRLKLITAPGEWQRCPGSWLYGGTFSVPLELALDINGQDEIHDSIGGEDYDFGIRLERAGANISICRTCGTFEDEDGHHTEAPMVRLDKLWPHEDGPYSSNRLLNDLLRHSGRLETKGNYFNLREVRETLKNGGTFPQPPGNMRHWVDNQPLSEM